jgi:hypothetical protein
VLRSDSKIPRDIAKAIDEVKHRRIEESLQFEASKVLKGK